MMSTEQYKDILTTDYQREIDQLKASLIEMRRYARHSLSCDIRSMKAECSCGFEKVVIEYDKLKSQHKFLGE